MNKIIKKIALCGLFISSLISVDLASAETFEGDVVFAVRKITRDAHWYANFGYRAQSVNQKNYAKGGGLRKLNLKTGKTSVILEDATGTFRDPVLSYEADKILFSYRKGKSDHFHLYEINIDGSGLKQLTDGPFSDIEPTYLPDGDIVFISSRCNRWVPCWMTQVANLYKCKGDGSDIHSLSGNIEQENTPWMLADGRIAYTRWEYIDRSQIAFHHLWVVNPDGTDHMALFGNMNPGNVFIDAKPIPGTTDKVVMVHSPGHGLKEHGGSISILSLNRGPDDQGAEKVIAKIPKNVKRGSPGQEKSFRDPYPLSQNSFLVARGPELLMMDGKGKYKVVYKLSDKEIKANYWLHEPRPIVSRKREPKLVSRVDHTKKTGKLLLMDAAYGRNMKGVKKGEIKKLLILEALPVPVHDSGDQTPISYGGSFDLKRVIGTVPVEADGSAYFELPANRAIVLASMDKDDLVIKRMQSFVSVMPGETTTCIGCHENRTDAVPPKINLQAFKRPASIPEPIKGMPEIFDYPRDIQPLLDKHCISCHNTDKREGGVLMTGDRGPHFSHSYYELISRLQVADGRNLNRGNFGVREIGSSASFLMNKIDGSHHNVKMTESEMRKIQLWIDASATYPGTYAAIGSGMLEKGSLNKGTKITNKYLKTAVNVMERRCAECHSGKTSLPKSPIGYDRNRANQSRPVYNNSGRWTPPWVKPYGENDPKVGSKEWMKKYAKPGMIYSKHILYNLSKPEKSVVLMAPLSKKAGGYGTCPDVFKDKADPDYIALLKSIQSSKEELDKMTRFDMDNFQPTEGYVREMKRYGVLPPDFEYGDPINVYETDRKYWELLYE